MNALSRSLYKKTFRQCQKIDASVARRAMLEGHQLGHPVEEDATNASRRVLERIWNLNGESELFVPNKVKGKAKVIPYLRESWREGGELQDAMAAMKLVKQLTQPEPKDLPRLRYEPDIKSKQAFHIPNFDFKAPGEPAHILLAHPLLPDEFRHSVILLFSHNNYGTVGTVINRLPSGPDSLHYGGPVAGQTFWVFRNSPPSFSPPPDYAGGGVYHMLHCGGHIAPDYIMNKVSEGSFKMEDFMHIKGLAAWSHGQLASELSQGYWLLAECDDISKIFDYEKSGEDFTLQFWQRMLINMEDETGSVPQLSRIY
eukprot:TRINITY_DN895_c0_g1_i1.p1 TRINITY_DN895_c0_g1~~TRINITY_DN895_c0_g1_i1.p1  ORF type:complete len:313 (+),score=54.18 TRINITY_DN895_c0_g1_i1:227-1165(+)